MSSIPRVLASHWSVRGNTLLLLVHWFTTAKLPLKTENLPRKIYSVWQNMMCFRLLFSSHALVAVSHLPQSSLVKSCYFCCTYIIQEICSKYKSGSFNSGSVHHRRGCVSQPHSSLTSLSSPESHLSINEQNPILIGKSTWQSGGQCFCFVTFLQINLTSLSPLFG